MGEPPYRYYAEWEFPDRDAFKAAAAQRRVHGDRQGRDGDGHPVHRHVRRRLTEPDAPQPLARRARLRDDRLREGAAARDDHAEPARGAERLRLPDAARARARLRGRVVGRRDPRRRRHRRGPRVLRRRRPQVWGADYLGNPKEYWKWFGAFKDTHDRLREIGKPTLARINGIGVGGGNELQMACDLAVMVDDAFIRHVGPEHGSVPAGGATQWLPILVGDRRAREIIMLCERDPGGAGRGVGARQPRRAARGARRGRRRVRREARDEAAADDPLREAAAQLLARPLLARDGRPRARLARALDARRRGAGGGAGISDRSSSSS